MKKIALLIFIFFSINNYSQEGYNEDYQFKKINSELKKHYEPQDKEHFFYKLISIKEDILKVEKFTYSINSTGIFIWKTLYIPMSKMDTDKPKYKRGILIYTKERENIITTYTFKKNNPDEKKLNVLNLHPRAGKEGDKEIMEMLITLFKNH